MQTIHILMTRPAGSNPAFLEHIETATKKKLMAVTSPLIEIVPVEGVKNSDGEAVAVFSSGNGVTFAPPGAGRRAYCVGPHTTVRALDAGWDAVQAGQDAAELIETLKQISPEAPIVHYRGVHQRVDVAAELSAAGLTASSCTVYDQVLRPLSSAARALLSRKTSVVVPLFSPRTAKHFAALVPPGDHLAVVAMSKAVAEECKQKGYRTVSVARLPTAQAMAVCVEKRVNELCPG